MGGFVYPFTAYVVLVGDYGFIDKFSVFAVKPCSFFS